MNLLNNEQQQIQRFHWSFFGCFMQQTPEAVLSLNRLLNQHNFDTIIELGTHDGGLSSLFALYCWGSRRHAHASHQGEPSLYKNSTHHKSPKIFYTFDIFERDVPRLEMLKAMGAVFKKIDFLEDPKNIEYVRSLIKDGDKVLLLCDGGNKKKEFELYAPSLKPGDFIMAHDWAKDQAAFEKNKTAGIWYGWETKWEDGVGDQDFGLKAVCEKNNIEQVYAEEFDKAVWFCGRKK